MKPSRNGRAKSQLKTTSVKRKSTPTEAQVTQSLVGSEEYFRTLIENASDLITILDADGLIRYESPSLARVLGFAPQPRDLNQPEHSSRNCESVWRLCDI